MAKQIYSTINLNKQVYYDNLTLESLGDVSVSNIQNNQVLAYDASTGDWQNMTASSVSPVTSVFGRTGAIVATNGDYNISQITNSSPLASISNVSITSPSNGQILEYNAGVWSNTNFSYVNTYYTVYDTTSTTPITAVKNTHYILEFGGTITINPMNPGEHLRITSTANAISIGFTGPSCN